MADATFDGVNLIVTLPFGERELDAGRDLYSAWKRWVVLSNNMGFPPAFRTIAGDPTKPGQVVEPYYFFRNDLGWRYRPSEEDQETIITGNLYRQDSTLPMKIPTIGNFNAQIELEVSPKATVVEKIVDSGTGLSPEQQTMLLEIYKVLELDVTDGVRHTKTGTGGRIVTESGDIDITLTDIDPDNRDAKRQP